MFDPNNLERMVEINMKFTDIEQIKHMLENELTQTKEDTT